ncbi:MAG: 6-pyruvoyl tetrahydropterin synthase [Opitutae bacterium]|nr:6-pyruvoyl tetrahydropterin synthase [Opitutae bacterium]
MIICTKTYRDIPLSHRQPFHEGRCSRLHGHSWAITLTFEAKELDGNGFVIDFGDLHFLKDWIDENLDHSTALKENDPMLNECEKLEKQGLLKILLVESASCEGIAQFLYHTFQPMIEQKTNGRVRIQTLHLEEDSKNSATYSPEY